MITIATLTIISNFILMHQAIKLNNQRKIIEKIIEPYETI